MAYKTAPEMLSFLSLATTRQKLRWQHLPGDCYCSVGAMREYRLDWLYWYSATGTTLGRMGLCLSYGSCNCTFLWGTPGMEIAKRLLDAIDGRWVEYHTRLREGCIAMLPEEISTVHSPLTKEPCIHLLAYLLEMSASGTLAWNRELDNQYVFSAKLGGKKITIRFLEPVTSDDQSAGLLVAEFSIPSTNLAFACGTEGYDLIEEMISHSIPEFRTLRDNRKMALETEVSYLKSLVEMPSEPSNRQ